MASRSSRGPQAQTATTRQNEYFVPRDGIDREVISADICRYLGNDALVRPGTYENGSGQSVQGYYITAYRNLTTAMIEDLKADSARWDNERRAQTTARHTSGVHYHQSETHQSRQHYGPSGDGSYQADPYSRDSGYDKRYPGTGAPGYTGANNQQQAPAGYAGGFGSHEQAVQPPQPGGRYTSPGGAMMPPPAGYAEPYMATGANRFAPSNDPYAGRPPSSVSPQQPVYATSAPQQPGYPATAGYAYAQHPTSSAGQYPTTMQSHDPFVGRASPAGSAAPQQPSGYSAAQQQQQQQHGDRRRR